MQQSRNSCIDRNGFHTSFDVQLGLKSTQVLGCHKGMQQSWIWDEQQWQIRGQTCGKISMHAYAIRILKVYVIQAMKIQWSYQS